MDPYVVVRVGGRTYDTTVKQKGGKTPVWNEILDIVFTSTADEVEFAVMDHDKGSADDVIGSAILSMAKLLQIVGVK